MTKVNCLNPIAKCGTDLLTNDYQITEQFDDADVVLVRSAAMHDLTVTDKLLAVARAGAGVNNIPIEDYAEKGIVVFNTPGANANGVKELVLAGLLLGSRDIIGGANWVTESKDDADIAKTAEKKKKAFAGNEIQGKKLGVIGLGAIGALVANAAVSLGMEVYGYDPYVSVDAAWKLSRSVKHITNVNDIYTNCDFITVHVPLLESTKGMINADAISRMKDGVVVLNFARDILIDEKALLEAIDEGHVKKYVTDFANPTVAGHKGVVCTPHLGASTEESEDNCAVMAVKEIRDFIENGNVVNSVNYPRCEAGVCEAESRITVCHKNIPNMLTQFTGLFAKEGINVSEMVSKSKGDYAYTILDISAKATEEMAAHIAAIDGVVRVRIVK
ncbi:MAG: phosphoglycerate dehydrogenase [Eubacterium sp.]|nr:phosphoglycerate dehydrogenase [Eubacterium sp.]MBR1675027.1 phosphoglycerate dehydrogenase [Eubacterium sp.]